GVKYDGYFGEVPRLHQTIDSLGRHRHAHPASPRQTIGFGADTDEGGHFQNLGRSEDLDHQVGADVSRADNRNLDHEACPLIYHFTFSLALSSSYNIKSYRRGMYYWRIPHHEAYWNQPFQPKTALARAARTPVRGRRPVIRPRTSGTTSWP